MNAIQRFNVFFEAFIKTDMWIAMLNTREDSPWHREANVSEHTRMLLRFYFENFANKRSDQQQTLTLLACLFHDVGKPPSQIIKFSEERGEYRAYHGHEQVSARMWVDFALSNPDVREFLHLTADDVSNIAFMIEHHVPFATKDPKKRKALKDTLMNRVGESGHRAWLDMLLCDQHGRISDNQHEKLAAVAEWMDNWEKV